MTFDGKSTSWETSPTAEAVTQADAPPAWRRFESDEIDGSLCDLPLGDSFERMMLLRLPQR